MLELPYPLQELARKLEKPVIKDVKPFRVSDKNITCQVSHFEALDWIWKTIGLWKKSILLFTENKILGRYLKIQWT